MPVSQTHPDYEKMLPIWEKNQDATDGEKAVKDKGKVYLPVPDPDNNTATSPRYLSYKERAVYTNFTGRTVYGLTGMVLNEKPVVTLPSEIEYLQNDIDGNGRSLVQKWREAAEQGLIKGRYVLVTTFPALEPEVDFDGNPIAPTAEQTANMKARIVSYMAEDNTNWNQGKGGVLDMLVLREIELSRGDDGFGVSFNTKYLVYRLRESGVTLQWYIGDTPSDSEIALTYADGSALTAIPADIIGSMDNDPQPDMPPTTDIASLNIAHYRNSADYEEGVYTHGQPMMHVDVGEMDQATFDAKNPNGIHVGSNRAIITQKGKIELVQAESNGAANEAMERKETQMLMLGAQIINPRSTNETLGAAKIRSSSETSVLSALDDNIEQAMLNRLRDAALFMGANPDGVEIEKSSKYYPEDADPQVVMAMIQGADRGAWAYQDVQDYAKRVNLVNPMRTKEDIASDVANQSPLS